jgi:hypothetical protein
VIHACNSDTGGDRQRPAYLDYDVGVEDGLRSAPNSETPDAPRCTALVKRAHGRLLASAANLSRLNTVRETIAVRGLLVTLGERKGMRIADGACAATESILQRHRCRRVIDHTHRNSFLSCLSSTESPLRRLRTNRVGFRRCRNRVPHALPVLSYLFSCLTLSP